MAQHFVTAVETGVRLNVNVAILTDQMKKIYKNWDPMISPCVCVRTIGLEITIAHNLTISAFCRDADYGV